MRSCIYDVRVCRIEFVDVKRETATSDLQFANRLAEKAG